MALTDTIVETILLPPSVYKEKLRIVTFKISPKELHQIDLTAKTLGMTRSEFIRYALQKTLQEITNKRNP